MEVTTMRACVSRTAIVCTAAWLSTGALAQSGPPTPVGGDAMGAPGATTSPSTATGASESQPAAAPGAVNSQVTDQVNSATDPKSGSPGTPGHSAVSIGENARSSALRTAAASGNQGSIAVGTQVTGRAGNRLGSVVEVLNEGGRPAYVIVADGQGVHTPVPYDSARLMVHGNTLTLDEQRLKRAPRVGADELHDPLRSSWHARADEYWRVPQADHNP
jgi:hypothetical protein